ncbi:MAG: hypothetical protein WCR67_02425 [Bacilli bacterium]
MKNDYSSSVFKEIEESLRNEKNLRNWLRRNGVYCFVTTNYEGGLDGFVVPLSTVIPNDKGTFFCVVFFQDDATKRFLVVDKLFDSVDESLGILQENMKYFTLIGFSKKHLIS